MLIDAHCHIDAYPQPALALETGEAAGISTVAVTTSLASYVRTRVLCRHHPQVRVALGLHPRRLDGASDQWPVWEQVLATAPLVGEAGLDFQDNTEENRKAQIRILERIAEACAKRKRALVLHSRYGEAEAWDIITAQQVQWVIWHGYRPEAPRSLLYRAIEAGHFLSIGPASLRDARLRERLRAIPREQILTETNGPWGCPEADERAAALRETVAGLADIWRCSPEEAEAQVERNFNRIIGAGA